MSQKGIGAWASEGNRRVNRKSNLVVKDYYFSG